MSSRVRQTPVYLHTFQTKNHCAGSCTDQSWNTDSCSHYCENSSLSDYGDIRQCDGTNDYWICGQDVSDCSRNFTVPKGYVDDEREGSHSVYLNIPTAVAASFAPSSAAVTVSITVTTSVPTTVTAAPASSAFDAASSKSCSETTIGLGAGLGVGIPLLIAVMISQVLLWRAHRKIRHLQHIGPSQQQHQPLKELDASRQLAEIDGQNIHEAPDQK